jgi:hypothetical protein
VAVPTLSSRHKLMVISPPAAVITDRSQIASLEHDYEQVSAGVLAYRWAKGTRWYQVQYTTAERSGTVWLSESQAGRFRFLYDILHGGMAFLTDAWDGRLYKAPSHDAPHQTVSRRGERPDVAVAAAAGEPEKLWLLVVILDGNICEQASRSVMATGWVPAHSTSGRITVWHYSRGC